MKATDRNSAIPEVVGARDTNVELLSAALMVSKATVRRDLSMLAKQRHLVRTHGGATAITRVPRAGSVTGRAQVSPAGSEKRHRQGRRCTRSGC